MLIDIRKTTRLKPITNLEDLQSTPYDSGRANSDEWVLDTWKDSKLGEPDFFLDSLFDYFRTMRKLYLWGRQESAKLGTFDDDLLSDYLSY